MELSILEFFFYIRYSILFFPFNWVDCFFNSLFLVIKVSQVLFILFLQGLCCWSGVTLDKISLCPDKTEILKWSFLITIFFVIFPDKLVLEIDIIFHFFQFVLWVSSLSRPRFIQWFAFVRFIAAECIYFLLDACNFSALFTVSI